MNLRWTHNVINAILIMLYMLLKFLGYGKQVCVYIDTTTNILANAICYILIVVLVRGEMG